MSKNIFIHGSIRKRILYALLAVAFLSLFSFALVSLDGMKRLGDYSVRSSAGLGQDALEISKKAIETLARDSPLRITTDQANLCNAEFKAIEGKANVLADIAEMVWNNPGAHPQNRSYSIAEHPKDSGLISVYQYPRGIDVNRYKNELAISSSMDSFFKPILASSSNISDFSIGSPNGLFRRFPRGPVSPDYDVRKRDWYQRAVESDKPGWSAPYVGAIAKNLRIIYSKPVYRNKKLVAVVVINVPLRTINERIITTRLNNKSNALLVDHQRKIITREGMSTDSENWADPQKAGYFSLDAGSGIVL